MGDVLGRAGGGAGRRLDARYARWLPRLQVPLQLALLTTGVVLAPRLSASDFIWFALSVGVATGGIGITVEAEHTKTAEARRQWHTPDKPAAE